MPEVLFLKELLQHVCRQECRASAAPSTPTKANRTIRKHGCASQREVARAASRRPGLLSTLRQHRRSAPALQTIVALAAACMTLQESDREGEKEKETGFRKGKTAGVRRARRGAHADAGQADVEHLNGCRAALTAGAPAAAFPHAACLRAAGARAAELESDGNAPCPQVLPVLLSPALHKESSQPRDVLCSRGGCGQSAGPVLYGSERRQRAWRVARSRPLCRAAKSGSMPECSGTGCSTQRQKRDSRGVPAWCTGLHKAPAHSLPAAASRSWCPRRGAQNGSLGRLHSATSCRHGQGRQGGGFGGDAVSAGPGSAGRGPAAGAAAQACTWASCSTAGCRSRAPAGKRPCTARTLCLLPRPPNAWSAGQAPCPHLLAVRHVYNLVLQALQAGSAPRGGAGWAAQAAANQARVPAPCSRPRQSSKTAGRCQRNAVLGTLSKRHTSQGPC